MSAKSTVVLMTLANEDPPAFRIAPIFCMTCSVCASTSSPPAKSLVCAQKRPICTYAICCQNKRQARLLTYPGYQTNLTGYEEHVASLDGLRVRANSTRSFVRADALSICRDQKDVKETSTMPIGRAQLQSTPCLKLAQPYVLVGRCVEFAGDAAGTARYARGPRVTCAAQSLG